jgi:3-methyladenine DNA glycosylase AlkD
MKLEDAISELISKAQPGRDTQMAAYHKIERRYLGVASPDTNDLVRTWRQKLNVEERVNLADQLWETNIFEARLAAAKLLTQARFRPDTAAWDLIQSWVPDFDRWAIADHAAIAGQKRLVADPTRLDIVQGWTSADDKWTRRAALVFTLPWTKQNHPKPDELAARDRVLVWAATYVDDPERVLSFLDHYGGQMKPFARKEAARHLQLP